MFPIIKHLNPLRLSASLLRPISESIPLRTLTFHRSQPFLWGIFSKSSEKKAAKAEEKLNKVKLFPEPEALSDDGRYDFSKEKNLKFIIDGIVNKNKEKPFLLPPQDPKYKGKKTVVVEMDETILYTFFPDEHEAYLLAPARDYDFYVELPEHQTFLSIYVRNNFKEFLDYLKENTEPILFSNGVKTYVDKVMDIVDKDRVFIHRIYQDDCDQIQHKDEDLHEFTKDLNRLNRDLSQVILIDARPFNFWINPDNCIPICAYDGSSVDVDEELLKMMDILDFLKNEDDVRPFLRERYSIMDVLKETNIV